MMAVEASPSLGNSFEITWIRQGSFPVHWSLYFRLTVSVSSPEERARRRRDEAPERVARRDRIDSTRDASPLRQADDARHLDTTGRTVQDVVEEVLSWL